MNRSIAALLVCTVFLLATHGVNAFESDSSELTQLLAQAEQGDADAQFDLGWKYYERIDKDGQEAAHWLLLAAEQGNAEAQSYLGSMYLNGYGVAMDEQEGVKWLSLAANQGDQMAMNSLSHLDFQETMEVAEQGHAEARFELGKMYENGEGVAEDKCEALKWYREAAQMQHEGSYRNLGSLYSSGVAAACEAVERRNNYWLQNDSVQYELGWQYYAGIGIAMNRQEAAKWWRLAAEQGYADAQFYLGWMYDQGIEFAEDDCEAGWWYSIAANKGQVDALANMLKMWYEYNKEGVAIPNCDGLAFLTEEEPTFE